MLRDWDGSGFDYNVDYLGPGTIDTPEWKITDRARAYAIRAVAARLGLWGNHGYEATYYVLQFPERREEQLLARPEAPSSPVYTDANAAMTISTAIAAAPAPPQGCGPRRRRM